MIHPSHYKALLISLLYTQHLPVLLIGVLFTFRLGAVGACAYAVAPADGGLVVVSFYIAGLS